MLIFRNPQKDLLTLEMHTVKQIEKNRVTLKHQSAAEVAAIDRRLKAKAEQLEIEKKKPLPKLALTLPAEAKVVKQSKTMIELEVPSKQARPVVDTWRAQFVKEGWEVESSRPEDSGGSIYFSKGSLHSF